MAIDLGDAILAFAGGAAEQFNEDTNAEKASRLKMAERAQELATQAAFHQAQTQFSAEHEEYLKRKKTDNIVRSAGGPDSAAAQIHLLQNRLTGGDSTKAAKLYQAGQRIKYDGPGETPLLNIEAFLPEGTEVSPTVRKQLARMQTAMKSFNPTGDETIAFTPEELNSEALLQALIGQPNIELRELGDGRIGVIQGTELVNTIGPRTPTKPGAVATDLQVSERFGQLKAKVDAGAATPSETAQFNFLQRKNAAKEKDTRSDTQKMSERLDTLLAKETLSAGETLEVARLQSDLSVDAEKSPWNATVDAKTGNTVFTNNQSQEVIQIPGTLAPEERDDPKLALLRLQKDRSRIEEEIEAGANVSDNERRLGEVNQQIQKLNTITGSTPDDPATVHRRFVEDMQKRLLTAKDTLSSVQSLRELSKASAGGVPAFVARGIDSAKTTVRGIAEGLGFATPKTSEQQMEELRSLDPNLNNFLDNNLAAFVGANQVEKGTLLYNIAAIMRETGKRDISNQDVERAKSILSGLSGSATEEGALIQLEEVVKRKQRSAALALVKKTNKDSPQRRQFMQELLSSTLPANKYQWVPSINDYNVRIGLDSDGNPVGRPASTLLQEGAFDIKR